MIQVIHRGTNLSFISLTISFAAILWHSSPEFACPVLERLFRAIVDDLSDDIAVARTSASDARIVPKGIKWVVLVAVFASRKYARFIYILRPPVLAVGEPIVPAIADSMCLAHGFATIGEESM